MRWPLLGYCLLDNAISRVCLHFADPFDLLDAPTSSHDDDADLKLLHSIQSLLPAPAVARPATVLAPPLPAPAPAPAAAPPVAIPGSNSARQSSPELSLGELQATLHSRGMSITSPAVQEHLRGQSVSSPEIEAKLYSGVCLPPRSFVPPIFFFTSSSSLFFSS